MRPGLALPTIPHAVAAAEPRAPGERHLMITQLPEEIASPCCCCCCCLAVVPPWSSSMSAKSWRAATGGWSWGSTSGRSSLPYPWVSPGHSGSHLGATGGLCGEQQRTAQ